MGTQTINQVMKKHLVFLLGCITLCLVGCMGDNQEEPEIIYENPAIYEVNSKIKAEPDNPDLYHMRATLFYDSGLYDEAIADMKKAMSYDSSDVYYRHFLADVYFDSEKEKDALDILQETIDLFPASEPTLLKLSEFQYILEQNDPALATIQQLLETNPENIEGYYMKGKTLMQKGEKSQSIATLKKALELDEKHFDSLLELGTIYSNDKNKAALPYLEKALSLVPSNPDIVFELGRYYFHQKEDEKALDYFRQVVILDQQYTDAHINTGIIYLDKKAFKKAYDIFNIAVETDPIHPPAYYHRGLAASLLGNAEQAKADLQQALDLAPDYEAAKEALVKLE